MGTSKPVDGSLRESQWYDPWWVSVVGLVVCFPVGFYALYKSNEIELRWKWTFAGAFFAVVVTLGAVLFLTREPAPAATQKEVRRAMRKRAAKPKIRQTPQATPAAVTDKAEHKLEVGGKITRFYATSPSGARAGDTHSLMDFRTTIPDYPASQGTSLYSIVRKLMAGDVFELFQKETAHIKTPEEKEEFRHTPEFAECERRIQDMLAVVLAQPYAEEITRKMPAYDADDHCFQLELAGAKTAALYGKAIRGFWFDSLPIYDKDDSFVPDSEIPPLYYHRQMLRLALDIPDEEARAYQGKDYSAWVIFRPLPELHDRDVKTTDTSIAIVNRTNDEIVALVRYHDAAE